MVKGVATGLAFHIAVINPTDKWVGLHCLQAFKESRLYNLPSMKKPDVLILVLF